MKKWKIALGILCFGMILGMGFPKTIYAGDRPNQNNQDYYRWATPINDYLVKCSNGQFMSVRGSNDGVLVKYYNSSFNELSNYNIKAELPIFGGFYEDENAYYILSGQNNPNESDSVEVFRVTKYDKTWKRINSVGLYGANTTVPFNAGSARMDSYGKYLAIRTCHEMYESSDGLNHQANVTIIVDTEKMEITDSFHKVMNVGYGYVSHSFNQFIKIDNGTIVGVDHGDAYPRSIYLAKYPDDITDGKLHSDDYRNSYWDEPTDEGNWVGPYWATGVSYVDAFMLQEATESQNYNITGASIGGFEFSDANYLIAGNSVIQDADWYDRDTRNVFVCAVDKLTGNVTTHWITDYKEGEGDTTTPHLVKINDNSFILLWNYGDETYFTQLDASGQPVGFIYSFEGYLSECQPILSDNKLLWYVDEYYSDELCFYEIDLSDKSYVKRQEIGDDVVENQETKKSNPLNPIAKIVGVYIPENDSRTIRAGAIIETQMTDLTYECTVIDYDYAKWGTSPYPEVKRTTDKTDNWMEYRPSHPGMYGFCWRAIDKNGNIISEYGATHYFAGNTVNNVGIYVPDRNVDNLRFGMVFDAPDKDNVRITWFLYKPDEGVYEAILNDGLVKDKGVWQEWTKKPGRYWIMCRVTATNNPDSSLCWGVEVRDGVVIDPE